MPRSGEGVLRIEPCRKDDLLALAAILQQAPEAAAWSASSLAGALSDDPLYFLVARQGQQIQGFIAGRRVLDEAEILNLAVRPAFRRQGIAAALLQKLLQRSARDRVAKVFLEVRSSNAAAIAFYERHNFRPVGERPAYYQNPTEAALLLAWHSDAP